MISTRVRVSSDVSTVLVSTKAPHNGASPAMSGVSFWILVPKRFNAPDLFCDIGLKPSVACSKNLPSTGVSAPSRPLFKHVGKIFVEVMYRHVYPDFQLLYKTVSDSVTFWLRRQSYCRPEIILTVSIVGTFDYFLICATVVTTAVQLLERHFCKICQLSQTFCNKTVVSFVASSKSVLDSVAPHLA